MWSACKKNKKKEENSSRQKERTKQKFMQSQGETLKQIHVYIKLYLMEKH